MESWAYQYRVQLDFIRPGSPTENGYIESFNGRSRDECRCARIAPWAIALPRSSLHSGRLPRRPRRKHFRRRRKTRHRAKYWSLSIESVECTNCQHARLNRITQAAFSTSGRSEFAGQVMEVAALACYCTYFRYHSNVRRGYAVWQFTRSFQTRYWDMMPLNQRVKCLTIDSRDFCGVTDIVIVLF